MTDTARSIRDDLRSAVRKTSAPVSVSSRDVPPRRRAALPPGIVVIGASTGGPQALVALIKPMAGALERLPVCVTLHMPPELMPIIAAHVARICGVATTIVTERQPLEIGRVYFAPGDRHLDLRRTARSVEIDLTSERLSDFCKPAVDVMFAAAARTYGARAVGIVLSGMGKDGLVGAGAITAAGGTILAQDKQSSAVWGMPGAVANAELTSAILPPADLAREIIRRLQPSGATP